VFRVSPAILSRQRVNPTMIDPFISYDHMKNTALADSKSSRIWSGTLHWTNLFLPFPPPRPPIKLRNAEYQCSILDSSLFWLKSNVAHCEGDESNRNLDGQIRQDIVNEKARVQAEIDRLDGESCLSCLVTGVATCVGLAGYFGYLAMEDMHMKPITPQVRQRIAFFGVMSVGWLGVGAYRLYLG